MKRKKLPRLCKVLGVVPGEIFAIETAANGELQHCWVEEDGLIYCKLEHLRCGTRESAERGQLRFLPDRH